jgi:hypothetical protein
MAATSAAAQLAALTVDDGQGVLRVAQLVKGEPVLAPPPSLDSLRAAAGLAEAAVPPSARGGRLTFRTSDAWVLREPAPATTGEAAEARYTVFARLDPGALVEADPAALARGLYALPFDEVLDFAARLRDAFAAEGGGPKDPLAAFLPALLDPKALAEAVDRDLGSVGTPGRAFLDRWVEVDTVASRGFTARLGDRLEGAPAPAAFQPVVRAVPTRQLHITAGNSPIVPVLSFLRALLTKGAATIKSASDATGAASLLAAGLRAADPRHPLTRHTSLVYWPGGDRSIEDRLFAPGAYDRVVVWGGAETVRSVRARARDTPVLALEPRYGISLLGRLRPEEVEDAAARAAADALIGDQKACTASLVHYVAADEATAIAYCEALQRALARWDDRWPRPLPRAVQGRLRLLRRGPLLRARWFENAASGQVRSAVALSPGPFDLSLHPLARFVVVRRVASLEDALPHVGRAVSTAGVYPEGALASMRDALAASGVSSVFPLGECERVWAGIPHDGMRTLSDLVSWTCSSGATANQGGGS